MTRERKGPYVLTLCSYGIAVASRRIVYIHGILQDVLFHPTRTSTQEVSCRAICIDVGNGTPLSTQLLLVPLSAFVS